MKSTLYDLYCIFIYSLVGPSLSFQYSSQRKIRIVTSGPPNYIWSLLSRKSTTRSVLWLGLTQHNYYDRDSFLQTLQSVFYFNSRVHVFCSSGLRYRCSKGRGFREFSFAVIDKYMELI